jgi:hypothetical protein
MSSLIPNFGVAVHLHMHVRRGKVDQKFVFALRTIGKSCLHMSELEIGKA